MRIPVGPPPVVLVRCHPSGRMVPVSPGTTLREAVVRGALPLGQSCDGVAVCGCCRVRVLAGADSLSPAEPDEARVLAERGAGPDERLACCARVRGSVTVSTGYW